MMSISLYAQGNESLSVLFNGTQLAFDVAPQIINDRALVPMRAIFEAHGAQVDWNCQDQCVTATKDDLTIELTIGQYVATVNGKQYTLDAPSQIIDDRTLVPVRFVSEALDADVTYNASTKTIYISSPGKQVASSVAGIDLGTSVATVKATLGEPKRISTSMYGFSWYTYHNNYDDFAMIGIENGQVVAIYSKSPEMFAPLNIAHGDRLAKVLQQYPNVIDTIVRNNVRFRYDEEDVLLIQGDDRFIRVFSDRYEDNSVSAVMVVSKPVELRLSDYYGPQTDALERAFELQLYDLINADRVEHGYKPMAWAAEAIKVSQDHSQDMIDRNFFDHINPSGLSPHQRLQKSGFEYSYSAENIACGQFSSIFAHEDLMNSSGHRSAILGKAKRVATGVQFGGSYQRYYTQTYYTPK